MQEFEDLAAEAKTSKWEEFCVDVHSDRTLRKFWQLHKSMKRRNSPTGIPTVVLSNGEKQATDEIKGKAFLE